MKSANAPRVKIYVLQHSFHPCAKICTSTNSCTSPNCCHQFFCMCNDILKQKRLFSHNLAMPSLHWITKGGIPPTTTWPKDWIENIRFLNYTVSYLKCTNTEFETKRCPQTDMEVVGRQSGEGGKSSSTHTPYLGL